MQKGSVRSIAENTGKNILLDASAKTTNRFPTPTGQYGFNEQIDDGSHDVPSLFCKTTYHFNIQ